MPRDNQGNYSPPNGTLVQTGDTILVSQHNPFVQDVSQAVTESLARDGRGGMRGPLNMNGYPIRNAGPGTEGTDVPNMSQLQNIGVPIGGVIEWFADELPDDTWLWANGAAVSRSDYAALFSRWGTRFGAGDGVTTFNVVDRRGRVGVGRDMAVNGSYANRVSSSILNTRTLGAAGGVDSVTLTVAQMPKHSHALTINSAGAHVHGSGTPRIGGTLSSYPTGGGLSSREGTGFRADVMPLAGAHTHTGTAAEVGGGAAHTNIQPSIVCNYIIKAR